MLTARCLNWVRLALLSLVLTGVGGSTARAADPSPPRGGDVPGLLVTTQTKQVYRFHFSGLQGADAVRFAQQLWPVVSKLPPDNPLHRTLADAKDRAGFIDDYRSLRASFLEAGIDTIYFLADAYWIESTTLPGRVALAGDTALRDRLQRRLQAAGHDVWAATVARLQPAPDAADWLVAELGAPVAAAHSPERRALVEHALRESCPIEPATAHLGSLPALRMALNNATPITVVNLEPSSLDTVLTQVLTALVPSSAEAARLSRDVQASTVAAAAYPMTHVRQVAHLKSPAEAAALAAEVQKQINGAVQKVVDLDDELGPLLGLFAQSMVMVSTHGSDVHLVMKPPALFDLSQAQSRSLESQDLDWTALPAPGGYHWEVIGALGIADRRDVFARVRGVRVRGGTSLIGPDDPASPLARFRIPLPDSELVLFRNLKGQLKVDVAPERPRPAVAPALELLDEQGRLAAVLRLDLGPGDPRFDLARSRAVLAKRIAERTATEQTARKAVDTVENLHQRAQLDGSVRTDRDTFYQWQDKLRVAYREHRFEETARVVFQELDDEAREAQRQHPGATLVPDGTASAGAAAAWAVDRRKFPFAGQWLFDHGVLTLYQDASGTVAGVYATKVFYYSAKMEIDRTKPITGSAILVGRAKGSELPFTMYDHRGRERTGKLSLKADGTVGTWHLTSTEVEPPGRRTATTAARTSEGTTERPPTRGFGQARDTTPGRTTGRPRRQTPGSSRPNPFKVDPQPSNPFRVGPAKGDNGAPGTPATQPRPGLPTTGRAQRDAEPPRNGVLDRIETAAPERLGLQDATTASFAGYWVHATDKRMNILFESEPSGLLVGMQGNLPVPNGNLRAAAVGNLLLILENVNIGPIATQSIVGAMLSADGEQLVYLAPRARAPSASAASRSGKSLELTRDRSLATP